MVGECEVEVVVEECEVEEGEKGRDNTRFSLCLYCLEFTEDLFIGIFLQVLDVLSYDLFKYFFFVQLLFFSLLLINYIL